MPKKKARRRAAPKDAASDSAPDEQLLARNAYLLAKFIARRDELGLNNTQLAKLMGVKQPRVPEIFRGEKMLGLESIFKLCKALKLKPYVDVEPE